MTPQNIITHPSQPRHRSLAELLAALRVAEREGIGFDRMVLDMVRFGYPPPSIEEIPGPHIRAALVATTLDESWIRMVGRIRPAQVGRDLNALLLLRRLVERRWVDVVRAVPVLQRTPLETEAALRELAEGTLDGRPVVEEVRGVPGDPVWCLADSFWSALIGGDERIGFRRRSPARRDIALDYARERGRISSTELAGIVGADSSNTGPVLKALEQEGLLGPGRENRRGPGFFYVPADSG